MIVWRDPTGHSVQNVHYCITGSHCMPDHWSIMPSRSQRDTGHEALCPVSKVLQKLQATIHSIIAHNTTHAMRALATRTGNVTLVMRPPYVHWFASLKARGNGSGATPHRDVAAVDKDDCVWNVIKKIAFQRELLSLRRREC